jgi:hypothetical protein
VTHQDTAPLHEIFELAVAHAIRHASGHTGMHETPGFKERP